MLEQLREVARGILGMLVNKLLRRETNAPVIDDVEQLRCLHVNSSAYRYMYIFSEDQVLYDMIYTHRYNIFL